MFIPFNHLRVRYSWSAVSCIVVVVGYERGSVMMLVVVVVTQKKKIIATMRIRE